MRSSVADLLQWSATADKPVACVALITLLSDADPKVRFRAAESLALVIGVARAAAVLADIAGTEATTVIFIECLPWMTPPRKVAAAQQRFAAHPCTAIAAAADQAQREIVRLLQRNQRR